MSARTASSRAPFGATGLEITAVTVGTGAWGLSSPIHGVAVAEETARALATRAFEGPLNALDTSNEYGAGESERRVGLAIRDRGGLPDGFVLQTKLDRDPVTGSFDADRMRRSLDESLERLGLDRVPVLCLHDPEHIGFEAAMADGGPVESLVRFREEGYAARIGISGGPIRMLTSFVETGLFDTVITHNRYTLVDRSAEPLLAAATARGLGVMNAAVYGGGVLARWPRRSSRYHYAEAPAELLAAIDAMGAACERHGVPFAAAALQFSLRDERIHSTVCGMVRDEQLDETLALAEVEVPAELWDELEALCPPEATWIAD